MSQPSPCPDVSVAVERQGAQVTVTLVGEIDLATVGAVSSSLARLADGDGCDGDQVVLDLSGVGFMGASGLSALVTAEHALRRRRSTLRVRGPQRRVAHLFELTHLGHFVEPDVAPRHGDGLDADGVTHARQRGQR